MMGCWRWFNKALKEAGVEVTEENEDKVEEVIHEFIGETSKYGSCSHDWKKAGKKMREDEADREKLIENLRAIGA